MSSSSWYTDVEVTLFEYSKWKRSNALKPPFLWSLQVVLNVVFMRLKHSLWTTVKQCCCEALPWLSNTPADAVLFVHLRCIWFFLLLVSRWPRLLTDIAVSVTGFWQSVLNLSLQWRFLQLFCFSWNQVNYKGCFWTLPERHAVTLSALPTSAS